LILSHLRMFPSTRPMDAADSQPPPAPRTAAHSASHTALSSLSPSLLQDLLRFEPAGTQRALLEVLAACVRHTQPLAITVGAPDLAPLVLSVFPTDRQVHCAYPLADVLAGDLAGLQVLEVQPARWRARAARVALQRAAGRGAAARSPRRGSSSTAACGG
jgi:hypothetical protein